jgi:hypothetical protein
VKVEVAERQGRGPALIESRQALPAARCANALTKALSGNVAGNAVDVTHKI